MGNQKEFTPQSRSVNSPQYYGDMSAAVMDILSQTPTKLQHLPDREPVLLDLFSTSPTKHQKCYKNAPYLCIPPQDGKPGQLYQLCCNDWLCPRCGELRARHEYGKIVEGCRTLAAHHPLYFLTLTCRGDVSLPTAEEKYLEWTNRLLDWLRLHVKRSGGDWYYSSVTERQQRGHPHSHYIVTGIPDDVFSPFSEYERYIASISTINSKIPHSMRFTAHSRNDLSFLDLHSEKLILASVRAGLGAQVHLTEIDTIEGAARYVAKYLFKSAMFQQFPKGWKRVRYSNNFPKPPKPDSSTAFPLLTLADWQRAARCDGQLVCHYEPTYEKALLMGCYNAVLEERT